jgi:hypothetical protein
MRIDCSAKIQADLERLRDDYILHEKSPMLAMISMATNEMIQLAEMYPGQVFILCGTLCPKSCRILRST